MEQKIEDNDAEEDVLMEAFKEFDTHETGIISKQ